jgi:hypothetical protein
VGWALLGCYLLHAGGGKEREEKGLGPDSARREKKEERNPFPFCIFYFQNFAQFEFTQEFKTSLNLINDVHGTSITLGETPCTLFLEIVSSQNRIRIRHF